MLEEVSCNDNNDGYIIFLKWVIVFELWEESLLDNTHIEWSGNSSFLDINVVEAWIIRTFFFSLCITSYQPQMVHQKKLLFFEKVAYNFFTHFVSRK